MLKFCPECGSKINGGKFCGNCGADLTKYEAGAAGTDTGAALDDMLGNVMGYASERREEEKRRAEWEEAERKRKEAERAEAELKNALRFFEYNENIDGTYTIKKVKDKELLVGSITIPRGVTSICASAFEGCNKIIEISLPDTLIFIDYRAFYSCYNLTKIVIPSSVTSINSEVFSYCDGLTSIMVDKNNSVYHSVGNCIIETASKTLWVGCKNSIIPSDGSVTSIGDLAFSDCRGLKSIAIPNSVTSIGFKAFYGCCRLTSVEIADSVTSISEYAFANCNELKSVSIPNNCRCYVGCYCPSFPSGCQVIRR